MFRTKPFLTRPDGFSETRHSTAQFSFSDADFRGFTRISKLFFLFPRSSAFIRVQICDDLRQVSRAAFALLLLGVALSVFGCTAANSVSGANLVMKDYAFAPQTLQAHPGKTVRLVVKNQDAVAHTFTIQSLNINQNIPARQEAVIEFQAPAEGIYQYVCLPHPNMRGTIEVKP